MPDNGKQVTIGGRVFTFSPITLGLMRRYRLLDDFKVASAIKAAVPTAEEIEAMLRILHASATVAEPELTFDQFCAEGFDALPFLDGVMAIAEAIPPVLNMTGLVKKPGDAAPGEAPGSQS
jgi:hypothetical protein